jgi:D-arabinose 1-dehydrogenase-like Zn-dependent alcohol dehydrogenase
MLGWVSGYVQSSLAFSQLAGMRPIVEEIPLERVSVAYQMTTSSTVHFRAVRGTTPLPRIT